MWKVGRTFRTPAYLLGPGLAIALLAPDAYAWNGYEHQSIGAQAYHDACERVARDIGQSGSDRVRERFRLACTTVAMRTHGAFGVREMDAYEDIMGEWSALAADHTRSPDELMSIQLGDILVDYRVMTKIAVTNYRHFHPASVLSWRTEHLKSLDLAVAASQTTTTRLVENFERALAVQAFAQHYLQDSFASGHMAFNRVASSNAAALAYHNAESRRGRCVSSLSGEIWITYGDGHLDDAANAQGKQVVVTAATLSLYDFLSTFVTGAILTNRWQETLFQIPAFYKARPIGSVQADCAAPVEFSPLRTVSTPAESIITFDFMTVADRSLWRGDPIVVGTIVGASFQFMYTIPLRYRVIQNRLFVGAGASTQQPGPRAFLLDVTYLWHVGTSLNGTLTHEVGIGQHFYWSYRGRYETASIRGLYAVSIEAGRVYVRLQAGAAKGWYGGWAPHVSAGVGWVHRSTRY